MKAKRYFIDSGIIPNGRFERKIVFTTYPLDEIIDRFLVYLWEFIMLLFEKIMDLGRGSIT